MNFWKIVISVLENFSDYVMEIINMVKKIYHFILFLLFTLVIDKNVNMNK